MSQKIYDIKPPQKKEEKKSSNSDKKNKKSSKFWVGIGLFLLVIFAGIYFFIFHVEVKIWPETTGTQLEETFTINAGEDFSSNGTLKGTVFETEFFEEFKEFEATGTEDSATKAKGTIIIENKYWESNTPLLKGTRFESEDGKIFRTQDGVVVPKVRSEEGQVVPGKVEVEVVADEPGSEYNIKPTEFNIPGLEGDSSYNEVTAFSEEKMIGGAVGERTVITEEDIQVAREEILNSLLKEGKSALQKEKEEKFLLEEDSQFDYVIEEEEVTGRAGEAKESFSVKIRAKINALTFTRSDFIDLLKDRLVEDAEIMMEDSLVSEKKVYEDSISYNYKLANIDWEKGTADLDVEFAGEVFAGLNKSRLLEKASGNDRGEFEGFLQGKPFIREARVRFSPFGIGLISENEDRIKINLSFD